MPDLVQTVRNLAERGVGFQSLQEQIDTTTAGGTPYTAGVCRITRSVVVAYRQK